MLNAKNEDGETPIICAAKMKNESIVILLAKQDPDISVRSRSGKGLIDYLPDLEQKEAIVKLLHKVIQFIRVYVVVFPPENWLYSSFPPGEI